MSKVLITGSSGLVGSEAVKFFGEKGWEVIGIDNNMRSQLFGTKKQEVMFDIDIREEDEINKLFSEHTFDAIIHAAAQPSHDWAQKEPLTDFDINARATLILLEATRKNCPDATFVYVSTDKVYGENMDAQKAVYKSRAWKERERTPEKTTYTPKKLLEDKETRFDSEYEFHEDLGLDFAGQRSLFGCSKTAADIYVQEYGNYFGMKTACFRCGCITGKNHQGAEYHGFLAYLAKCIKEGITYKIFGYEGKQVRDQIHAYDLVNAFWHFIQKPKVAAVYNMGGGPERSVSILEAAKMISAKTGHDFQHEFHEERKGDRIWDVHDVSKFRTDYPEWDYRYSLSDIINDLA